jgi:hypothetical protein
MPVGAPSYRPASSQGRTKCRRLLHARSVIKRGLAIGREIVSRSCFDMATILPMVDLERTTLMMVVIVLSIYIL